MTKPFSSGASDERSKYRDAVEFRTFATLLRFAPWTESNSDEAIDNRKVRIALHLAVARASRLDRGRQQEVERFGQRDLGPL